MMSTRLLGQHYFLRTRLPVTGCQYTNKNLVPAVVHMLKTCDRALSIRKNLLPWGGVPTEPVGGSIFARDIPAFGGFQILLATKLRLKDSGIPQILKNPERLFPTNPHK